MESVIEKFERVYIDEVSRDSELAQRVLGLFPQEKIEWTQGRPLAEIQGELSSEEFARSKRLLYLTEFKGHFFKRCPGAKPGLTCCNYFVLNWGQQCDMNCSYCYLQSFINSPALTIYTNIDKAIDELREFGQDLKDKRLRVGTGETVDSLSLDELTGYSAKLIEFFRDYPTWNLELKTKSDKVDHFLDVPHAGNIIASWSINPQYIVETEEHGTASLKQRLDAAEKCRDKGFIVSFHIDPMIWHPEWKENYADLVDDICQRFSPDEIPYMSIGALRFQPEQRHMMRERFGMKSHVVRGEMFPGKDGKLRYDLSIRKTMYDFIVKRFKEKSSKWNLFFCMETPETWLSTVSKAPQQMQDLKDLFDHKVTYAFQK